MMSARAAMAIGWSSFLAACLLELLVFGLVDPLELPVLGGEHGPSRQAVYTLSFLAFWVVTAGAVGLGINLAGSAPDEARHQG